MGRSAIFETLVGVVVLAVAAAFLVYAFRTSGAADRGDYRLSAQFGRIDGIDTGADVKIAGVKVGTVAGATLDPQTYEARLDLSLRSGVRVPDDSAAKILSDGMLGGAHVSIEPGASETMLRDGGKITVTQGSVDLLGLAVQAFTSGAAKPDSSARADEPAKEGVQ